MSKTQKGNELAVVNKRAEGRIALRKQAALQSLASGASMNATAKQTGVNRCTIYRWLKEDPEFRAAYNEWENSVQQNGRKRLIALADKAIDSISDALPTQPKLAMELATKLKMFEPAPAAKPTDIEGARKEIQLEEQQTRLKQEIAEMNLNAEKGVAVTSNEMWNRPMDKPQDHSAAPKRKKRKKEAAEKQAGEKGFSEEEIRELERMAREMDAEAALHAGTHEGPGKDESK